MIETLYSRIHQVSHFQIDLACPGGPLAEIIAGNTLVIFTGRAIKIATAWDDNASTAPEVRLTLSRAASLPHDALQGLFPLAAGPLQVGADGLEAGNFITGDVTCIAAPPGDYSALVFADRIEPATARHVHVCLLPPTSA